MGNRRVGRKRLYQLEKQGIACDLGSGAGISKSIVSSSQHRQGQEIITEIAIDLDSSAQELSNGGAEFGVIAEATKSGSIAWLQESKYGIVTEIRMVIMEDVSDNTTISLALVATADKVATNALHTSNEVLATARDKSGKGSDTSEPFDDGSANGKYLYLVQGDSGLGDAPLTAGKVLIYIHGFVAPTDL